MACTIHTYINMYECEWSPYLNGYVHSLRWQVLIVALSMYKVSHGHGVESVLHRTSDGVCDETA